jgi:sterol 3beta-glucosyltransferase
MRFTVVTYGSEGDTRPLVALCQGLIAAGHQVQLFAEQSTMGSAQVHAVPVQALAGDIRSTLPLDDPARELRSRDLLKTVRNGLRVVNSNTAAWMKVVADDARGSDAILFSSLAVLVGYAVAQELNKPAIALWLQPWSPTREFASPLLPPLKLPGWANLLSYRAGQAFMLRAYGKATNAARKQIFGQAARREFKLDFPMLYGFSHHLVHRPNDWPETHQICGHWPLALSGWQPPNELLEFLSAGAPPIYVGFGAVSSFIRQKGLTAIISGVAGRRALFYPGWSKITKAMLPDNFFVVGETPHAWLFPLTSMVIHHGGAGTTHSAARAGVPSVPLPIGTDQFFWASRLAAAGVAPKYMRGTKIDDRSLAKMIAFAEQDEVRRRARLLGSLMSEEDGVGRAVQAIETQMALTSRRGTARHQGSVGACDSQNVA